MKRWQQAVIFGALLATALLPWFVQWPARAELRREIRRLEQHLAALPRLETEHERLTNLVAETVSAAATRLTQAQESVKLGQTVGLLRRQTNELTRLAAANFRASRALLELARGAVGKTYPGEAWSYAGYEKPEDAVQSTLWASRTGNLRQLFNSGTPAFQAMVAKQLKDSKEDFDDSLAEMRQMTEYRITDASVVSDDMVVLYVWFQYPEALKKQKGNPGYGAPLYVKRTDSQWKLDEP